MASTKSLVQQLGYGHYFNGDYTKESREQALDSYRKDVAQKVEAAKLELLQVKTVKVLD